MTKLLTPIKPELNTDVLEELDFSLICDCWRWRDIGFGLSYPAKCEEPATHSAHTKCEGCAAEAHILVCSTCLKLVQKNQMSHGDLCTVRNGYNNCLFFISAQELK